MNRIERAKAAGWRIECLGDQQDGLWNWGLYWGDDLMKQSPEPLASEVEAWEHFFDTMNGLRVTFDTHELTPADAPAQLDRDEFSMKELAAIQMLSDDWMEYEQVRALSNELNSATLKGAVEMRLKAGEGVSYRRTEVGRALLAPAQSTAGERPDTELSHADFMDTLRTVLDFPPSEEFGTWAAIEAIRQDRALLMTYEAQLAQAQAALTQIDEYATEELGEWLPVQEAYMPTDKLTFSYIHAVAAKALQASTPAGGEAG